MDKDKSYFFFQKMATISTTKPSKIKMGDKVTFNFGGNVAHIFSKEDEKNLEW